MPARGDFLPTASLEVLHKRAELLQQLRSFFQQRNFLEVETPILSSDCVIDRYLDPFSVTLFDDPRRPQVGPTCWLQTSPEFAMKRLLSAGLPAIFQITRAFRAGESGRHHNPEFTIVEWYRAGDDQRAGIQLLADICAAMLPWGRPQPIRYRDAFQQHVGIDPHLASIGVLHEAARTREVAIPQTILPDDRSEWLNLLLSQCVEPELGNDRPTILYDYPVEQAALANVRPGSPPVAERFELYVKGLELANGYHELLDAVELRRRNSKINQQRRSEGKFALPEDSRLLAAMRNGLPASAGVALGFDRLVMLAVGATSIDEVLAFPIARA